MVEQLKVKKICTNIDNISYANSGDAGIDLRASGKWVINLDSEKKEIVSDSYELASGERILIKTGIGVKIPEGHFGSIRDRSGLAMKNGLHCLAGVIDETYRGEIGVILVNTGKNSYILKKNDRIAQMIIQQYVSVDIKFVKDLDETSRGSGGFGSSGRK